MHGFARQPAMAPGDLVDPDSVLEPPSRRQPSPFSA
jgi:hypothetical protein